MIFSLGKIPDRTRPHNVNVAVKLLYTAFGIELVLGFIDDFLTRDLFSFGGLFGLLLVYWIYWALIRLIGHGHKKALVIFLICVVLNWTFVLSVLILDIPVESFAVSEGVISPLSSNPLFNILTVSSSVMNIISLFLLFQNSSFEWFGPRADAERAN